jgi:hypothetical protein
MASPALATRTLTTLAATTEIYGKSLLESEYSHNDANVGTSGFASSLYDQAIATSGTGYAESQAVHNLVVNDDIGTGDFLGLSYDGDAYAQVILIAPVGGPASGGSDGESRLYVAFTVTEETPWSISNGVAVDDTGLVTRPGVSVLLRPTSGPWVYSYLPPFPPSADPDPFFGSGVLPAGEYELIAYVAAEAGLFTSDGQSGSVTSEGSLEFVFTLPEPAAGWLVLAVLPLMRRRSLA